jgi:secreted trypsin-like serine protease
MPAAALAKAPASKRVVGGTTVTGSDPAPYPFMASLTLAGAPNDRDGHFCGGSLIAPDRVLTAGHCLDGFTPVGYSVLIGVDGNAVVRAGDNKFTGAIAHGGIPARGFAIHPKFRESFPFAKKKLANAIALDDVGIILLARPVTGIAPVKLSTGAADEKTGEAASLFGYGFTGPSFRSTPKALQTGAMTVISARTCAKAYPRAIIASEICGQDLKHHSPLIQACAGDSGGPVVVSTPAGPVQIGVTSWGPETMNGACGEKLLPDVYMRTAAFRAFIDQRKPVIEPFLKRRRDTSGGFGSAASKVVGTPRVGRTVTCKAPKLGGDRYKLSYAWSVPRSAGFVDIRGATKQTFKITSSFYRRQPEHGHRVACTATARNAGGHLSMFSGTVQLKR